MSDAPQFHVTNPRCPDHTVPESALDHLRAAYRAAAWVDTPTGHTVTPWRPIAAVYFDIAHDAVIATRPPGVVMSEYDRLRAFLRGDA